MQCCVLTISSAIASREQEDECGPLAAELAEAAGLDVAAMEVVPDDFALIEDRLHHFVDDDFALILTIGGTGLGPDAVTPEATYAVLERPAPGIAEAIRAAASAANNAPAAMLSRGTAGISGRTLIVNLPATAVAVRDGLAVLAPVLDHALNLLRGDGAEQAGE